MNPKSTTKHNLLALKQLSDNLTSYFKVGSWWPSLSKDEIIIGAVLTQNTTWKNVERSLENLKVNNLLELKKLSKINKNKLTELIKPSGFYTQKSQTLIDICKLIEQHASLQKFFELPLSKSRKELLSIKGVGPETADSILLYSGNKPIFVVDNYTRRITKRFLGLGKELTYGELQESVHLITKSVNKYKELHGSFVELAKKHCKKEPLCDNCPINKSCSYFTKSN